MQASSGETLVNGSDPSHHLGEQRTPSRLKGDRYRTGCKQCQKNRERAMAKARQLRDEKVERLTKGCEAGNEGDCMTLRSLLLTESYREQNRYRPELHRRG